VRIKLLLMIFFVLLSTVPLFAYIDPGTGSYVIQLIIAGVLAGGFVIKTQWKRLVAFFKGRSKRKEAPRDAVGE
jgi:hypothetical protein